MDELLDLTEDELLETIGNSLSDDSRRLFPLPKSSGELREAAQKWLTEQHTFLQQAVCGNERIRAVFHSPEREFVFHAVCDVLTAVIIGVHVGAVSAYIIKRGLYSFCNEKWSMTPPQPERGQ